MYFPNWASQVALVVKNPPANAGDIRAECSIWVRKIPWSRKWQPIPGFLAWKIPWTEEPCGLQSIQLQRVRHD